MTTALPSTRPPTLSICIATYNRSRFIAETLDSIVGQLGPLVDLVVVDGASSDDTGSVVGRYLRPAAPVRYFREAVNSGVDGDYDKAVGYATGDYCWLMTDDDLMEPGAVARVLASLAAGPDLVVVNSRVLSADLSKVLMSRFLTFADDREYDSGSESFFIDVANYLSFIGSVIIKRSLWMQRDHVSFNGTVFAHVGVLFQAPRIGRISVVAEPLIRIRYGNAMWTPRGFEIWMFKWPALIWGFAGYSGVAKAKVCAREPWKSTRKLVHSRGIGSYSMVEFRNLVAGQARPGDALRAWLIARMPGSVANALSGLYCFCVNREARAAAYDLARSEHSTWISRLAARSLGV